VRVCFIRLSSELIYSSFRSTILIYCFYMSQSTSPKNSVGSIDIEAGCSLESLEVPSSDAFMTEYRLKQRYPDWRALHIIPSATPGSVWMGIVFPAINTESSA